jgi:hypothetical protein
MEALIDKASRLTALDLLEQPIGDYLRAITVWAGTVERTVGGIEELDMILLNADTGERVALE